MPSVEEAGLDYAEVGNHVGVGECEECVSE